MRKKLNISVAPFERRWPVFAVGFLGGREFVLCVWLVTVRVSWGY
jgi:nitrate reductase NapE component